MGDPTYIPDDVKAIDKSVRVHRANSAGTLPLGNHLPS
jgi:hypothetical protein